jgi:uncharacterized protein (DUF1697 family)
MDGPCQATALGTLIAAVRPGQTAARVSLTAPTRVTRRLYPVHAVLGACFDVVLATWPLRRVPSWDRTVARFVAFLRAVNLGERRVAMATARGVLEELGYDQVGSYANSGNLLFSVTGNAPDHEAAIRSALEEVFGFELTTFVRTARQVNALATDKPFGVIAPGHTHFALLPLIWLTATEKKAVEALSNDHDEVVVRGRDVHWLIRSRSPETTLGPRQWRQALPDNPTTARNAKMLEAGGETLTSLSNHRYLIAPCADSFPLLMRRKTVVRPAVPECPQVGCEQCCLGVDV